MKLTNLHNLPAALVTAASRFNSNYKREGHISVTQLIDAPQVRLLSQRHWDDIEEDITDRIWALFGSAVHEILHQGRDANTLTEERLSMPVNGWTVSGQSDLYESDGVLSDWKVPSVWSIVYGKIDWVRQLNVYRAILAAHGFDAARLQVVAILRDWQQRKAAEQADYPQRPVVVVPIELWPLEQTHEYMIERVALHQAAEAGQVPPCSADERWEKPTAYAVMKNANVRAARVLDSAEAAQAWIAQQAPSSGTKWRVDVRPGESTRCASYCRVSQWCPTWAAIQQGGEQAIGQASGADAGRH